MTEQQKEALKCIESQLKHGYIDVGGAHEECEIEIIKEAIGLWKFIDKWGSIGCTSFPINKINVVTEDDDIIATTDFTDEQKNLEVWKAIGLQEEDFYK